VGPEHNMALDTANDLGSFSMGLERCEEARDVPVDAARQILELTGFS
jgi:hypothetical protein